MTCAGEPTLRVLVAMLFVTSAFMPTTAPSPIDTPFRIDTHLPSHTCLPITIGADFLDYHKYHVCLWPKYQHTQQAYSHLRL